MTEARRGQYAYGALCGFDFGCYFEFEVNCVSIEVVARCHAESVVAVHGEGYVEEVVLDVCQWCLCADRGQHAAVLCDRIAAVAGPSEHECIDIVEILIGLV